MKIERGVSDLSFSAVSYVSAERGRMPEGGVFVSYPTRVCFCGSVPTTLDEIKDHPEVDIKSRQTHISILRTEDDYTDKDESLDLN